MKIKVQIINKSENVLPAYSTKFSSGMDLRANASVVVLVGQTVLVPTGLFIAIEEGYEAQIRPRSGLAIKCGIEIVNSPGTIDADFRGEVCIILKNEGSREFPIQIGDRIAQMVFAPVAEAEWEEVEELSETVRGTGGFGHTGINEVTTNDFRRAEATTWWLNLTFGEREVLCDMVNEKPAGEIDSDGVLNIVDFLHNSCSKSVEWWYCLSKVDRRRIAKQHLGTVCLSEIPKTSIEFMYEETKK